MGTIWPLWIAHLLSSHILLPEEVIAIAADLGPSHLNLSAWVSQVVIPPY